MNNTNNNDNDNDNDNDSYENEIKEIKSEIVNKINEQFLNKTIKKAMKTLSKKNPIFKSYEKDLISEIDKYKKKPQKDIITSDQIVYNKITMVDNKEAVYEYNRTLFNSHVEPIGFLSKNDEPIYFKNNQDLIKKMVDSKLDQN